MPEETLAGVVLAAGESRRMGTPKAALELEGRTFLACVLDGLAGAALAPLVVVAGVHLEAVRAALPAAPPVALLVNPTPERGQLSSLKIALRHLLAEAPACAGVLVALVDHPAVAPQTPARLAALALDPERPSEQLIFVPSCNGRRGHPVVFRRAVWHELLAAADADGARAVTRRDRRRVREVAIDDPGILRDVDTPEDYRALRSGARAIATAPGRDGVRR